MGGQRRERAALPNVKVPVHVIAFSETCMPGPEAARSSRGSFPGAKLHLLRGMVHGCGSDRAHERINAVIEEMAGAVR